MMPLIQYPVSIWLTSTWPPPPHQIDTTNDSHLLSKLIMTKNLPSVINQPATILYLPYEILSQILTYSWQHIHYRSSFPSFARVQRSWTAPTLELLYRDVALSSSHKTLRVARSLPNGQNLHLTKKMKICYFTWIHEVGDILRSCVNLRHLELFILDNIPSDLFEYPSLRSKRFPLLVVAT